MRVIAGTARGRKLATFRGDRIRPTSDRVREALFSIINSRIDTFASKNVLDLYSGSGALSIEALSRGAESAILIDCDAESVSLATRNLAACSMSDAARVIRGNVAATLERGACQGMTFDLVFIDPPYNENLVPGTLQALVESTALAENSLVCIETARRDPPDISPWANSLELLDQRHYGNTTVTLLGCR